jgi:hypothetical protein
MEHPLKLPKPIVRVQELRNQNVLAGSVKAPYKNLQVASRISDANETSKKIISTCRPLGYIL